MIDWQLESTFLSKTNEAVLFAGAAETRQPKKGLRAAGSRWEMTETAETGNTLAPSNFKELSAAVGGALSEYMQSLSTTQKASSEKRTPGKQDL